MTENQLLRDRFHALGYRKVSVFVKAINSCLSCQTWGRMLNLDGLIDLRTLLIMSAELSIPSAQLRGMLYARKEPIIAEMVAPSVITPREQTVLNKLRLLQDDPGKIDCVINLIDKLAS